MTMAGQRPNPDGEILRGRARELAKPLVTPRNLGSLLQVLEFGTGGERYGIETTWTREVGRIGPLAPVPGTPEFVRGVLSLRGRILSLIDLRALLHLPGPQDLTGGYAIRISSEEMEFCLGVEDVAGIRSIAADKLLDPPAVLSGLSPKTIRGMTEDGLQLVDGEVLLTHSELMPADWRGGEPSP